MGSAASRYAATDAVSGENVRRAAAVVAVNGLERYWLTRKRVSKGQAAGTRETVNPRSRRRRTW